MTKKLAFLVTAVFILASTIPAEAQHAGKMLRVGYLFAGSAHVARAWLESLRQGLRELGYVRVVVVERYAAGRRERLPALAAELVGLDVDVIVTHGGTLEADRAAKEAGKTIPVVFAVSADPIGAGYVVSLARPGGNITGLSDLHSDLVPKRLELLKEVVPSATRVAVFWSPDARHTQSQLKDLQSVAPAVGVTLLPIAFAKPGDLERAFVRNARDPGVSALRVGCGILLDCGGRLRRKRSELCSGSI